MEELTLHDQAIGSDLVVDAPEDYEMIDDKQEQDVAIITPAESPDEEMVDVAPRADDRMCLCYPSITSEETVGCLT